MLTAPTTLRRASLDALFCFQALSPLPMSQCRYTFADPSSLTSQTRPYMDTVILSVPALLYQYRFAETARQNRIKSAVMNAQLYYGTSLSGRTPTPYSVSTIARTSPHSDTVYLFDNENNSYDKDSTHAAIAFPLHAQDDLAINFVAKPSKKASTAIYKLLPSTDWTAPLSEKAHHELLDGCVAIFPVLQTLLPILKNWTYSVCVSPELYDPTRSAPAAYLKITIPECDAYPSTSYYVSHYHYIHRLARLLYAKALAAQLLKRVDLAHFTWASSSIQPTDQAAYFPGWVDAEALRITPLNMATTSNTLTGCEPPVSLTFSTLLNRLEEYMGDAYWGSTIDLQNLHQRAAMLADILVWESGNDLRC